MSKSTVQTTGLSGKRVALLITMSMLVVGIILGYTLWVYSRLDIARKNTATAWRSLATELDNRYRVVEIQSHSGDGDAGVISTFEGRLRIALDGFRTTAQISSQRSAADSLESLLVSDATPETLEIESTPELDAAVEFFNASLQAEQQILSTPGGRLLDVFLEFPQHPAFQLAQ